MEFEYDRRKSAANAKKHGLDFEDSQGLWDDENHIIIPAQSDTEIRWALLGKLNKKCWIAFYTHREDKIRIISVRRARKAEETLYES